MDSIRTIARPEFNLLPLQPIYCISSSQLRLSLHSSIRPRLRGRSSKIPNIHILILHQLLQRRHDLVPNQLLALLRTGKLRRRFLLQRYDSGIWRTLRQPFEDINEHGVGFGDVETDVRDLVGDEGVENGEDLLGEDLEGEGWCKGLYIALASQYGRLFGGS